jgi:hypothetical protein
MAPGMRCRTGSIPAAFPAKRAKTLLYMASCVRETITGGTVTVGTQRSEVQSGHVRRIEGHCYSGRMELTGEEAHVGGRVFRGPAR